MASQHTSKIWVLRVFSRLTTSLALLVLLPVIFSVAALAQAPLFSPAVSYDSGGVEVSSIAVADVDGDGKLDLVVANRCASSGNCNPSAYGTGPGSVAVLLGNGDGTFRPAAAYPSGGATPTSVAVTDVNGDGKADILVANLCVTTDACPGPGSVAVLLGNGDGTFQPAVACGSGGNGAWSVALTDVNRDGKPDILVANVFLCDTCADGGMSVLLGNGDGTFQPAVAYDSGGASGWPSWPHWPAWTVAAADVNGDGKPDIIVTNIESNTVGVLLGTGDGTFRPVMLYIAGATGAGPYSVAVADINGDGKPDLVLTIDSEIGTPTGGWSNTAVSVLLGNGDGTFFGSSDAGAGGFLAPVGIGIADFNGDGIADLAVANQCALNFCLTSNVAVLLGNGDGTFQSPATYGPGGSYSSSIAVADVNGDGAPDVVVGNLFGQNSGDGSIGVLLNNSGPHHPTATALTSSLHSSAYGQTVSLIAKVTSKSGTPTGTVQILNGTVIVGSGTLVSGKASIPVSTLPVGSDTITAVYQGGAGYAASKSAPLTQTVTVATTTTSLVSSIDPAATNQSIVFTATVTSQYGGSAGGSVVFNSGSKTLGTASLIGNVAALATSFSAPGTYSIKAKYSGDANNTGSTSTSFTQTVIASTTTSLTSAPNPALIGQAITFTATVSSTSGTPPNGEFVTFNSGTSALGTGSLSGGTATLVTSSLPAGVFTITASYPGDATFAASTSPAIRQVVDTTTKSATSTAFTSSLNPSIYGQRVTWTATVTTSGPVPPTGKVNFVWSGYNIGTATLNSSGVAAFTRSNLNADTYPLIAIYVGDANNLRSTSSVVNQVITQATSSATLTSSPNPSSLGEAVTFTATITSPTFIPTGPVTFTAGKTVLGTAQLRGGKAKFTTSTLAVGKTMVKATYAGSSDVTESSATIKQTVQ